MFLHHQSMIFVLHCRSFSYTPCAVLCGEFLLHSSCCFMWGVSLTRPMLLYVGSYTPHAILCGEFLLHIPCCFMWGVSLTHPMLCYVGSFSYAPHAVLCTVESFSYTPHALLCGEFVLHTACYFMWGVSLTCPMLSYVRSFSYMSHANLCE